MTSVSQLAYTQARLQAQHGMRPTEQTWHRLAATGDLASYLQIARHTTINNWIVSIHPASTSHDIESTLRHIFINHVDKVARWHPKAWQAAVLWCNQIPLLPVLRHLLAGEPVPDWIRHDEELKYFTSENQELRIQALQASKYSPIVEAWHKNIEPTEAWLNHWQQLWPKTSKLETQALNRLHNFFIQHLVSLSTNKPYGIKSLLDLHSPLQRAFRQFSFQPAAAFAHLGLIALDLQQLRDDLVQRCLFSRVHRETSS